MKPVLLVRDSDAQLNFQIITIVIVVKGLAEEIMKE